MDLKRDSETFWGIFCRSFKLSNYCGNVKKVFQRRPSNLEALDGMRAIAISWVIIYHNSTLPYLYTFFMQCILEKAPYLLFIINGDMGVDMFFVLSGFLIGYMLLKEMNRYGSIDYKHFLVSRFLRIWPALLLYQIVSAPFEKE